MPQMAVASSLLLRSTLRQTRDEELATKSYNDHRHFPHTLVHSRPLTFSPSHPLTFTLNLALHAAALTDTRTPASLTLTLTLTLILS